MSDAVSAPPRVLHLVTGPGPYSSARGAHELHTELARRGHPSRLRALHPGVLDTPALGPSPLHPATLRALRAAARRSDVVLAHGSAALPAAAIGLLGTGVPFVHVAGTGAGGRTREPWLRTLPHCALLHCAAAVTAPTDGARQALIRRFRLPPERVRTIPGARTAGRGDPSHYGVERTAARAALGLPGHGPLVAWVGAAGADKRFDLALEMLRRLPDLHLAVVGEGVTPGPESAPRAHFLGRLDDTAPLYRAADALLLTSDSEGVPAQLIEAALAGLPAVATDVGWVRDLVQDGVTGALVAPGDAEALAEALGRTLATAPDLGAAARARALARFDLAMVTDAWQLLLHQLTGWPRQA
ncbi:glycosyltransferase family 4 protein [Kitasatospora sp. NPDC002227]|uniref:glycosyltransferase family 4 protein n=1 Tax=Kitasatospora sp. NPDC002227 TaxID=3154773 RepID=UPI003333032F